MMCVCDKLNWMKNGWMENGLSGCGKWMESGCGLSGCGCGKWIVARFRISHMSAEITYLFLSSL